VAAFKAEPALIMLGVARLKAQRQRIGGTGINAACGKSCRAPLSSRGTMCQDSQQFLLERTQQRTPLVKGRPLTGDDESAAVE
jgi:hypothetical protein